MGRYFLAITNFHKIFKITFKGSKDPIFIKKNSCPKVLFNSTANGLTKSAVKMLFHALFHSQFKLQNSRE